MRGRRVLRGIAWFFGIIAWLIVLGLLDQCVSSVLPKNEAPVPSALASVALQSVATALLAIVLSKRVAVPKAVAVGLLILGMTFFGFYASTIASLVSIAAYSSDEVRTAMIEGAAEAMGIRPALPLAVIALLRDVAPPFICAIAAFAARRGYRLKSVGSDRRPHSRIKFVGIALSVLLVVTLPLGSAWYSARVALELNGYAESWATFEPGQTVELVDGVGELTVPVGWTGDGTVVRELPGWTLLTNEESYPWYRQSLILRAPANQDETVTSHFLVLVSGNDTHTWEERLQAAREQTNTVEVTLPADVLAGCDAHTYTSTTEADGEWKMWTYVFVSDSIRPVEIICVNRGPSTPDMEDVYDELRMISISAR
ncbi:MAG: hypothetical protein AB2L09_08310 [Coriobacteriia bacterium]